MNWQTVLGFLESWGIEILATLAGAFFVWLHDFLPPKYRLLKRITYACKVSKAVSSIDVSIKTTDPLTIAAVDEQLSEFFRKDKIEVGRRTRATINFSSNFSGANYVITCRSDEEVGSFVNIECKNAFRISRFGRVIDLKDTVNELIEITSYFSSFMPRREKQRITTAISITPRERILFSKNLSKKIFSSQICVQYNCDNCSNIYTLGQIKTVNEGIEYLGNNIERIFYEWMTALI